MKKIILAFFIISCSSIDRNVSRVGIKLDQTKFHYDSIPKRHISIDSLEFNDVIINSNEILGTEQTLNHISRGKYLKEIVDMGTKFYLLESQDCGDNKSYLVYKERNNPDFDLKPYRGVFLTLRDKKNMTLGTLKLTEYTDVLLIAESESKLISELINDSTLITKDIHNICSDVIVDGKTSCWETTITTSWTIGCNKFTLDKADTLRVESK